MTGWYVTPLLEYYCTSTGATGAEGGQGIDGHMQCTCATALRASLSLTAARAAPLHSKAVHHRRGKVVMRGGQRRNSFIWFK